MIKQQMKLLSPLGAGCSKARLMAVTVPWPFTRLVTRSAVDPQPRFPWPTAPVLTLLGDAQTSVGHRCWLTRTSAVYRIHHHPLGTSPARLPRLGVGFPFEGHPECAGSRERSRCQLPRGVEFPSVVEVSAPKMFPSVFARKRERMKQSSCWSQ